MEGFSLSLDGFRGFCVIPNASVFLMLTPLPKFILALFTKANVCVLACGVQVLPNS